MPLISVVSPVYKAEGCVAELCRRLKLAIEPLTDDYEIILVEDRSPDNSWAAIKEEAEKDGRVFGIRLARNCGQHRAITAGLDVAAGDWVVVMDCDLQDAPEHIPLLYAKALEGNEIVVAKFEERAESTLRQKISQAFWAALSWLAGIRFDHKVGNFRIMSKRVVENFRCYREQLRLLGGITALMGFTTAYLPLRRDERFSGETSYSFSKLLGIAIDIAMAYSDKPLKVAIAVGLTMAGLSLAMGAAILVLWLAGSVEVAGWASVMVSLYLIGGLIIANLGVVGYYLGKTFDETKRRPLYTVENTTRDSLLPSAKSVVPPAREGGTVFWITGLSGAGKTTLCRQLVAHLRRQRHPVVMLDGDELREAMGATAAHSRGERLQLAMRYAHLCRMIAAQGVDVAIATISLFREVHDWNRENLPGYVEIFMDVPLAELARRDPKQIYSRASRGEIKDVAGIDFAVDEPQAPDVRIKWEPGLTAEAALVKVLEQLNLEKPK